MTVPSNTTAPAAMSEPVPITAPLRMVALMPMRQSSSTVHPWTTALCPTETRSPTVQGEAGVGVEDYVVLEVGPAPTLMAAVSARTETP